MWSCPIIVKTYDVQSSHCEHWIGPSLKASEGDYYYWTESQYRARQRAWLEALNMFCNLIRVRVLKVLILRWYTCQRSPAFLRSNWCQGSLNVGILVICLSEFSSFHESLIIWFPRACLQKDLQMESILENRLTNTLCSCSILCLFMRWSCKSYLICQSLCFDPCQAAWIFFSHVLSQQIQANGKVILIYYVRIDCSANT